MENSNMFAQRLKQVREERKMTQKTFSEFLEIKQQTLSGYETGKISPSLDLAANMSRKLKVSLDWLCGISNERVNINKQFDTYSEIIQQLVKIDKTSHLAILNITLGGSREFSIVLRDSVMYHFLEEWRKILELFHEKVISESLYDLWVSDKLKEYHVCLKDEEERNAWLDELEYRKNGPEELPF